MQLLEVSIFSVQGDAKVINNPARLLNILCAEVPVLCMGWRGQLTRQVGYKLVGLLTGMEGHAGCYNEAVWQKT